MLEVLGRTTSVRRGLRPARPRIYYKYALKNAIIPTVAVLGVGLGELMGGAVFVEVIFTPPGARSAHRRGDREPELPDRAGRRVLVIALLFIFANLVADLSYRLLDPRIRVEDGAA